MLVQQGLISNMQQDGYFQSLLSQPLTNHRISPLQGLSPRREGRDFQLRNLAPKTRVAILGSVGSGKSSFLAMLLGEMSFWDHNYQVTFWKFTVLKNKQLTKDNRRKFRSLTSDNMDSWKSSAARKKINRCGKKEDQQARNVREVAKCCVFQSFVCRLGRKVTSLKRRVRRWPFSSEMKNCTPLWREAHFEVKMYKTQHSQTTFWSWDVEKLHAAVARSTFWSQNVQNTAFSDHFLKLRCGKIARRCSEKHIFNQNAPLATCSDHFLKLWCGKIARRCSEKHISKSKC